jgi:hypothetical protein
MQIRPSGRTTRNTFSRVRLFRDRQVDHAVGDDHVPGGVGQRDRLHLAAAELGPAVDAGLAGVRAAAGAHLLEQVQADDVSFGADPLGCEDRVDAAAAADVEHTLARLERGVADRVADAERPRNRRRWVVGRYRLLASVRDSGWSAWGSA